MFEVPQLSPERSQVITATDSTILLGAVPPEWGTVMDVWGSKVGAPKPHTSTPITLLGHVLEPFIVELYMRRPDIAGQFDASSPGFIKMDDAPIGCTPDRIITNKLGTVAYGLECKSSAYDEWDEDAPPRRVAIQVQHSMLATDYTRWDVAAYVMTKELREELIAMVMLGQTITADLLYSFIVSGDARMIVYSEERDSTLCEQIYEVATHFWNEYVVKRIPPNIRSYTIVEPDEPEEEEASSEMTNLMILHLNLSRRKAEIDADLKGISGQIKESLDNTPAKMVGMQMGTKVVSLSYSRVKAKSTVDYKAAFLSMCEKHGTAEDERRIIETAFTEVGEPTMRLQIKPINSKKKKGSGEDDRA